MKSSIDQIVNRFRRESSKSSNVKYELEIRVQDVTYDNFMLIHSALVKKVSDSGVKLPIKDGVLTQMVGALMDAKIQGGEPSNRNIKITKIREIYFKNGVRTSENRVRKEPLMLPFKVGGADTLSYTVALSSETEEKQSFNGDERALIRVKARTSFPMTLLGVNESRPSLEWRVDMTVTRQIMGNNVDNSLKLIIKQMFATTPPMTHENILEVLKLNQSHNQILYKYEVEIEFVGPMEFRDLIRPTDIKNAASVILGLVNPEHIRNAKMQEDIYHIANRLISAPALLSRFQNEFGLKRLLPQAYAITRGDYRKIYPPKNYYLTEKADGKRAVAFIHNGRGAIISDKYIDGFQGVDTGETILDGEYVTMEGVSTFYAFDLIRVADVDVTMLGFDERLRRIDEAVAIAVSYGMPVSAKKYLLLSSDQPNVLKKEISSVYEGKLRIDGQIYNTDGLIFTENNKPYMHTTNLKWKNISHNTIDMLAKLAPASILGNPPYITKSDHKMYFLFVGINYELYNKLGLAWCPGYAEIFGTLPRQGRGDQGQANGSNTSTGNYYPIQFTPSDVPYAYIYYHPNDGVDIDGMIVEMRCAGGCLSSGGGSSLVDWKLTRIRKDRQREVASKKYFGNDFYTAELTWLNYLDKFPLEQLWEGSGSDYFMEDKRNIYQAQTSIISYVKTVLISKIAHSERVVDLCAGKGQDIGRYLEADIGKLIAVDNDRAALAELIRRKHSYAKKAPKSNNFRDEKTQQRSTKSRQNTTIYALVADANDAYKININKFATLGLVKESANALVCNMAVHYLLSNVASMRNFILLAKNTVKVGGYVILTMLIGEKVHEAFVESKIEEGGTWDIVEENKKKYSLKRLYNSDSLEPAGQRIGVILPFSAGVYYEEYLVNTTSLIAEFALKKFNLVSMDSVEKSISSFEASNPAMASRLTVGDKQWVSFYGHMTFQRNN